MVETILVTKEIFIFFHFKSDIRISICIFAKQMPLKMTARLVNNTNENKVTFWRRRKAQKE